MNDYHKKEELTDIIKPEAFDDPKFKKGLVLKFAEATIKLTRVDRKNRRVWGEHITLVNQRVTLSHYGHLINATEEMQQIYGTPFCEECNVPLTEESTEDGDVKAAERREGMLEDGTIID